MGDMIATCTSPQSRNRHVGMELGKGKTMEQIAAEMFMVAEGAKSAPAVMALAEEYGIDMPISRDVYRVSAARPTPAAPTAACCAPPPAPKPNPAEPGRTPADRVSKNRR
jgi:glycerol-3-phosphate dehydrogenase